MQVSVVRSNKSSGCCVQQRTVDTSLAGRALAASNLSRPASTRSTSTSSVAPHTGPTAPSSSRVIDKRTAARPASSPVSANRSSAAVSTDTSAQPPDSAPVHRPLTVTASCAPTPRGALAELATTVATTGRLARSEPASEVADNLLSLAGSHGSSSIVWQRGGMSRLPVQLRGRINSIR